MERACELACLFLFCTCLLMLAVSETTSSSPSTTINVGVSELAARPIGSNWVSYNGDYTGRRFSALSQINVGNVSQLRDRKSTRLNSSHGSISYAVFCLKKKIQHQTTRRE